MLLRSSTVKTLRGRTISSQQHDTASAKLWQESLEEEPKSQSITTPSYPNWTGDESIQDAVLRMLVEKYKPLRGGTIRTAEDKLKHTPPLLTSQLLPSTSDAQSDSESGTEHKPWLTTFRTPSHATGTSIKHMRLPPQPSLTTSPPLSPSDTNRTRILEREKKKKAAYAGRITHARESSLDYRIGKQHVSDDNRDARAPTTPPYPTRPNPNPVSIKGWTSLVEERIERARSEGQFRALKGRGKPLVREHEQSNPFIPREEFLMNRIVQRQGAAPPWVEFQSELDAAISSFRGTLQSTWTRRAVQSLMLAYPGPGVPSHLTLSDVTGSCIRDRAWEAREKGYHEAAVEEINRLVRRYNGVAPYAVRRGYLTREAELERVVEVCGGDILAEVARRRKVGEGDAQREDELGGTSDERVQRMGWEAIWKRWLAQPTPLTGLMRKLGVYSVRVYKWVLTGDGSRSTPS